MKFRADKSLGLAGERWKKDGIYDGLPLTPTLLSRWQQVAPRVASSGLDVSDETNAKSTFVLWERFPQRQEEHFTKGSKKQRRVSILVRVVQRAKRELILGRIFRMPLGSVAAPCVFSFILSTTLTVLFYSTSGHLRIPKLKSY